MTAAAGEDEVADVYNKRRLSHPVEHPLHRAMRLAQHLLSRDPTPPLDLHLDLGRLELALLRFEMSQDAVEEAFEVGSLVGVLRLGAGELGLQFGRPSVR